jgi:glycosyltransferase involved in cell wall biosynthesis
MPDYQLYICGPLEEEKDFEKVYYRELHETPNIHTVGMVDVTGPQFNEITEKCIGLIYPSCSEGGAGSVIHCMHAGIIPIISKESGIDVHDFGLMLSDCSVESIKFSLQTISNLSNEKLKYMTSTAWEEARANHSKDRFAEEYRKLIEKLIISHGKEGFCV